MYSKLVRIFFIKIILLNSKKLQKKKIKTENIKCSEQQNLIVIVKIKENYLT